MLSVGKQRAFAEWQIVPGQREPPEGDLAPCKLALQLTDVNWDGMESGPGHGDVAAVPARITGGVFFNGGNGPWQ